MSERSGTTEDIEKFDQVEVLDEEYIVEKILDKQKIGSVWKYKVKWEGYSEEECTWEPKENLKNVKYLIDEFESQQISKVKTNIEKSDLLRKKTKRANNNFDSNLKDDQESKSIGSSGNKREKETFYKTQKNLQASSFSNKIESKGLCLNENKRETELIPQIQDDNKQLNIPNKDGTIGNLEIDVPIKIINAKILNDDDVNINCLVKWKPRIDGTIPERSWISSKELKIKSPMVLFDFYESRIKFPKRDENNNS